MKTALTEAWHPPLTNARDPPSPLQQTILITIVDDTVPEPSKTFNVTLSSPSRATLNPFASTATVTISDDDVSGIKTVAYEQGVVSQGCLCDQGRLCHG